MYICLGTNTHSKFGHQIFCFHDADLNGNLSSSLFLVTEKKSLHPLLCWIRYTYIMFTISSILQNRFLILLLLLLSSYFPNSQHIKAWRPLPLFLSSMPCFRHFFKKMHFSEDLQPEDTPLLSPRDTLTNLVTAQIRQLLANHRISKSCANIALVNQLPAFITSHLFSRNSP